VRGVGDGEELKEKENKVAGKNKMDDDKIHAEENKCPE